MKDEYRGITFISGHRKITQAEFEKHYASALYKTFENGDIFIVGDYYGVDHMAQKYLKSIGCPDERLRVYHMLEKPRCCESSYCVGGFKSDEERDAAMTEASKWDIAWVRPGKENSGTAQNIARRQKNLVIKDAQYALLALRDNMDGKSEKFETFFIELEKTIEEEWAKVSKEYVKSDG